MPLPDDFYTECLYDPEAWYLHDLEEVDPETGRVVATLDTTQIDILVPHQRAWPGHIKHLPGAVMIQMTATLAQLHAIYVLGLRATEGWIGFGARINKARFPNAGLIGPPVRAELTAKRVRRVRDTVFAEYAYRYEQGGKLVYYSEQTAAWLRTEHRGPLPG